MKKLFPWLLIMIFATNLASCANGSYASTPPKGPLPDILLVERVPGTSKLPSLKKEYFSQTSIQKLYIDMWGLSPYPTDSVFSCGIDLGLVYNLSFLHDNTLVWKATAYATGCGGVKLNTHDLRRDNSIFWQDLKDVILVPIWPN